MSWKRLRMIAGFLGLSSLPTLASASSITVKAGGGTAGSTPAAPAGDYESAALSASLDLSKVLSLDLSLTGTHDNKVPPAVGTHFANSGENILSLTAGLSWSPDDHFSLGVGGDYSPKNSSTFDTLITASSTSTQEDGLLSSTSRSWGLDTNLGYDTAGESGFESSFSTDASFTHLSSLQALQDIVTSAGSTNLARIRAECVGKDTTTCRRLRPLFRYQQLELRELAITASYTATIEERTGVSVGGTYYNYLGDDPTQIGFFSVALIGRGAAARLPRGHASRSSTSLSFGEGVPLEPLSYSLSAGLSQELGALNLGVTGGYGSYYGDLGNNKNLALRASVLLGPSWKLILTLSGNHDTDQDGNGTNSGVASLAVRYKF